jgi:diguanylate cyclase (GGDEF)-like protein
MLDRLDQIFLEIENVLGNDRISDEIRIDYASAIFRSNEQCLSDAKILYNVVGDMVHELLNNYISDFRLYIPLLLRIYRGFTDSTNVCYLGYTPGRKNEIEDRSIKPMLSLKASVDNDIFSWGAGQIYEFDRFVNFPGDDKSDSALTLVMEGAKNICKGNIDCNNTLIIPLYSKSAYGPDQELYGFIAITNNERSYTEYDINIADKITSYFAPHLRNFEILRKDQLTHFYNQRQKEDLFTTEIKKAMQNNYCIGLILLDLDDFKAFNDTNGHLNGDSLLSQFGKLILSNIRPYDRAIRVGGEEFLIIAPKVGSESLQSFAERLRFIIEKQVFRDRFGEPAYRGISASFGVLLLDDIERKVANTEYYFDMADKNLYAAKRKGKNRIEYSKC